MDEKKPGPLQEQLNAAGFYEVEVIIEKTITGLGLDQIGIDKAFAPVKRRSAGQGDSGAAVIKILTFYCWMNRQTTSIMNISSGWQKC